MSGEKHNSNTKQKTAHSIIVAIHKQMKNLVPPSLFRLIPTTHRFYIQFIAETLLKEAAVTTAYLPAYI